VTPRARRADERASAREPRPERLGGGGGRRLCSPDLVWHASGRGPRSGSHRGLDEVFAYLAAIGDAAERFDSQFERILVGDDHVAVFFKVIGKRGGRSLDTGFILVFRIAGDRIAEIWAVPRDQYAVDEFWGQ
jgi:ketosteroid isomerase-like protein